jgi:FkbM family methyltransferase
VLARYFHATKAGFFVDVGAHDPMRFSNTYLFYRRGWRGVNIDAMPGSMRLFNKYRQGDANIETGIATTEGELPFFIFNEPALNSFDEPLSRSRESEKYNIVEIAKVSVRPLRDVIRPYLPRDSTIPSFLTVDVEGRDLDVLRSNDWASFRPTMVLAECLGATVENAAKGEVAELLSNNGYSLVAKTMNTAFYELNAPNPDV